MKYRVLLFGFIVLMASPPVVFDQANAVDAAVNGYINDNSGRVLVGAQVKLTNTATGISQQMVTDANGYYRFPLVPVGTYTLVASADGFEINTTQGIVLRVGQEARLDISLGVGNTSQAAEVDAGSDIIDTGTSTVGAVLTKRKQKTCRFSPARLTTFSSCRPA